MSDFDPDAYLAKKKAEEDFDPDAYLRQGTGADAGSPLDKALKEQAGNIVTVDTPTGPAQFTRSGQRFYAPEEAKALYGASMGAQMKEGTLGQMLYFLSQGGKLVDEMKGAKDAASPSGFADWVMGRGASPADRYFKGRDQTRLDVAREEAKSPTVKVDGVPIKPVGVMGAMLPYAMAPVPATWGARILGSGASTAIDEVGNSTADLARGELGDFAKDVGRSGMLGLAAGGVAEGAMAPFRALGSRVGVEAGMARDAVEEATQAARDKAVASARGSLGNVVMSEGNSMETVMNVLRNPQWFPDDVVRDAYAVADSPEGREMLARAARNNMAKLRQSMPLEASARDALSEATSAAAPSAVASEVAAKTAPDAILSDVAQKGWNSVGQRTALAVGGGLLGRGLGSLMGYEDTGTGVGMLAGFSTPGTLQFLRNQAKSPVVQFGALKATEAALDTGLNAYTKAAQVSGPVINTVAGANARQASQNAYQALMQRFGISAKTKEQLADEAFLAGQTEPDLQNGR